MLSSQSAALAQDVLAQEKHALQGALVAAKEPSREEGGGDASPRPGVRQRAHSIATPGKPALTAMRVHRATLAPRGFDDEASSRKKRLTGRTWSLKPQDPRFGAELWSAARLRGVFRGVWRGWEQAPEDRAEAIVCGAAGAG